MIVPTLYCVFWFGTFGGAAIGMQMRADHMGLRRTTNCPWQQLALRGQTPGHGVCAGFSNASTTRPTWSTSAAPVARRTSSSTEISANGGKGFVRHHGLRLALPLFYFITSSDSRLARHRHDQRNGGAGAGSGLSSSAAVTEDARAWRWRRGAPHSALNGVSAVWEAASRSKLASCTFLCFLFCFM